MKRERRVKWECCVLYAVSVACSGLAGKALAQGRPAMHVDGPVWGCVNPSIAAILNDPKTAHAGDAAWLAHMREEGECRPVVVREQWQPLTADKGGFTYLAARNAAGRTRNPSLWLPTAHLLAVPLPPPEGDETAPPVLSRVVPPSAGGGSRAPEGPSGSKPAPASAPGRSSGGGDAAGQAGQTPQEQTRGGHFSWGPVIWVLLALGGVRWWYRRRKARKPRKPRKAARSASEHGGERVGDPVGNSAGISAGEPVGNIGVSVAGDGIPAAEAHTAPGGEEKEQGEGLPLPSGMDAREGCGGPTRHEWTGHKQEDDMANEVRWYAPGRPVTMTRIGVELPDGMVYAGAACDLDCPYAIQPNLVISDGDPDHIGDGLAAGSQPAYGMMSPASRYHYLCWLAEGRRTQGIDPGYLALFIAGLEQRLLHEEPSSGERTILLDEIMALQEHYSAFDYRFFRARCYRLMDAVWFRYAPLTLPEEDDILPPEVMVAAPFGEKGYISPFHQLAIGRAIKAGEALDFASVVTILFGQSSFCDKHWNVLSDEYASFLAILEHCFRESFPSGLMVEMRRSVPLVPRYRTGYEDGFSGAGERLIRLVEPRAVRSLPDPLSCYLGDFGRLADKVGDDLWGYVGRCRRAFGAGKGRDTLDCLEAVPAAYRSFMAGEAGSWLASQPSPAAIPFGELAGWCLGSRGEKWTMRQRKRIHDILSSFGHTMIPDPSYGTLTLEDDTVVQLCRCPPATVRTGDLDAARTAAMLVARVLPSVDDGADHKGGIKAVLETMGAAFSFGQEEKDRLEAEIRWSHANPVTTARMTSALRKVKKDFAESCGKAAVVAAYAQGEPDDQTITLLEKAYKTLGLGVSALRSDVHACKAGHVWEPGQAGPFMAGGTTRPQEDPAARAERLARSRAATSQLTESLNVILRDDEPPAARSPSAPASQGEAATPAGPEAGSGLASGAQLDGLDEACVPFLAALGEKESWTQEELEALAGQHGLMAGAAQEDINEWAFDHHDRPILEGEDPVTVDTALISRLLSGGGA